MLGTRIQKLNDTYICWWLLKMDVLQRKDLENGPKTTPWFFFPWESEQTKLFVFFWHSTTIKVCLPHPTKRTKKTTSQIHPNSSHQRQRLHPGKLTWSLKITQLKRKIIFHPPPFLFLIPWQGYFGKFGFLLRKGFHFSGSVWKVIFQFAAQFSRGLYPSFISHVDDLEGIPNPTWGIHQAILGVPAVNFPGFFFGSRETGTWCTWRRVLLELIGRNWVFSCHRNDVFNRQLWKGKGLG